jgi:hypothetical protein
MSLRRRIDQGCYAAGLIVAVPVGRVTSFLLVRRNQSLRSPVIDASGKAVVSLTSHGARIANVYQAIESIGRGTALPSRLILWLDKSEQGKQLPQELNRLADRGLEIVFTQDYKPHTKYYPYVASQESFHSPLVTADDDTLYPSWWLARLVAAYRDHPETVNCYRSRAIAMNGNGLDRYTNWGVSRKGCVASFRHIALGVSGIIYPPALLQALKNAGTGFIGKCLTGDDLWLHVQAIRNGFKIRQIDSTPHLFPTLSGTQRGGLSQANLGANRNDELIQKTYNEADIEILRSAAACARHS